MDDPRLSVTYFELAFITLKPGGEDLRLANNGEQKACRFI